MVCTCNDLCHKLMFQSLPYIVCVPINYMLYSKNVLCTIELTLNYFATETELNKDLPTIF